MKRRYLLLLLFTISFYAKGQEKVWKKQVSRIITLDTAQKSEKATDSILIRTILDAVKSGKVGVYPAISTNDFTTKMTNAQFNDFFEHNYTTEIQDPVTGNIGRKTSYYTLLSELPYQYKVFEEWEFNPTKGKVSVEIKYIGPMRDIYGDDGTFRGHQTIFWLDYKDFYSLIEQKKATPLRVFSKYLWLNYFEPFDSKSSANSDIDPKTGAWHGTAMTSIDLRTKRDTVIHLVSDEHADTPVGELIVNEIRNIKMSAWSGDNTLFNKLLTVSDITTRLQSDADTQTVVDPVTGDEKIVLMYKNYIRFAAQYGILEDWSFNPVTGKTQIEIKGTAPLEVYHDNDTNPMFWVRYNDIQPILNRIELYNPNNTFAMHIWDSFFSDTKPALVH